MAPPPRNTRGFATHVPPTPDPYDEAKFYDFYELPPTFDDPPQEVLDVITQVQAYIFTRRVRAKEFFLDFDPLRAGRCTPQQFLRALSSVVPILKPHDMKVLMDYYTDRRENIVKPQVVCYLAFVRAVDAIFVVPDLEKQPTLKVPRPGSTADGVIPSRICESPRPCADEELVQQVLYRLALLTKTRGVIFRGSFQDAERSLDTSLLCPRFSGKVTEMQFLQHFPLMQDVNDYELHLLLQRYGTESGDINYVAMDKDLQNILSELSSEQVSPNASQRFSMSARSPFSRPGNPATTSVMGKKEIGSLRLPTPQEQHSVGADLLCRIKEEVAARRLRVHGSFQEMDKLRRGCVTMGQARTALTVLRIDLDYKELEQLQRIFDKNGLFNYTEFCNAVNEVPLSAKNGELPPTIPPRCEASPPPSRRVVERVRVLNPLLPEAEDLLAEAELWLAKKSEQRRLNVKLLFQDYDRSRCGRVTRSQFLRIMDNNDFRLNPDHLDVLLEAYGDEYGREFSYLDLCTSIQRRAAEELGMPMLSALNRRTPEPSKYFTRKGQIIPLDYSRAPLSARPYTAG